MSSESKSDDVPTIVWTKTDEAPMLATFSLLPIVQAYMKTSGIDIRTSDISVAARVLSHFPDSLKENQRTADNLGALGVLTQDPAANIIKLPNISASVPQLKACIKELQGQGYAVPNYPEEAKTDEEKDIQKRYKVCLGSAVNPVLREGNSDRRGPPAVKAFARKHPHSMGEWSSDSKSHVATMQAGDFCHNEQSTTIPAATTARIELTGKDGNTTVLMPKLALHEGEILDGTFMSKSALVKFLGEQIAEAKANGTLFSLHMKATMMKVSDPIIFGHCVKVFFKSVFDKHADTISKLGVNVNNGFGDLLGKIASLPADQRAAIEGDIAAAYAAGPDVAMVDSDKGITNLHVPSDVIIDASMPAMLRAGGQMWNKNNKLQDAKCVIPDSSYAGVFQAVFDDCKKNGKLDVTTMGTCPNVGLMAQKAEEYGSHNKTFEIPTAGTVRIVDNNGDQELLSFAVEAGDIWRACQVQDPAIKDWVKLAVNRSRLSSTPIVFWLDENRPHDRELIKKVNVYLKNHDTAGLDISILAPAKACAKSLDTIRAQKDIISVTGNVLRDYNTDLFPILELGTSAKMLSIVPLMKGGGLFETGAGGSAPKHVQQFTQEGHLRWDSLGEFLALAVSLQHIAEKYKHAKAGVLGSCLDLGTTQFLLQNKSPSRKVKELDNRGSHFYLALFWARELAAQTDDKDLATLFTKVAKDLGDNEQKIVDELNGAQGSKIDIKGYYNPDEAVLKKAMRPSATLNAIVDALH